MKRNTIQKQIILDAINKLASHPTAEEVFAEVNKKHKNISKATVYRNLAAAAESGEISSVGVIEGAMHFDHNTHSHFHFVCDECKKVFDVDSFKIPSNEKLIINKVEVILRGFCEKCQKEKK